MEVLIELLGQLILELVVQGGFEFGVRGILAVFGKDDSSDAPWLASVGYCIFGAVAGFISIWLIPMHVLNSHSMQLLNLTISPALLGLVFRTLGRQNEKRGRKRRRSDRFLFGFAFAMAMGLTRYFFAA